VTKGLSILLGPKFLDLSKRLDRLDLLYKELSDAVVLKEDRQEVDHLREHITNQINHMDSIVGTVKDKMMNLDELRTREIRTLSRTVDHKATATSLNNIAEQVHALNMAVTSKAEVVKVEQLTKQLGSLSEHVGMKASNSQLEDVAKQIQQLSKLVSQKVSLEQADTIQERIKGLTADVLQKASCAKMQEVASQLHELAKETQRKAESEEVEHLSSQVKGLRDEVAHRAENSKMEHYARQVEMVHDELVRKAENSTADRAIRQLHALNDAMSGKADTTNHNLLNDQLHRLREDIFSMKADFSRLDELGRQLENISATVTVDSAKVRHLCHMYATQAAVKTAGSERQEGPSSKINNASHVSPPATPSTVAPSPSPMLVKQQKSGLQSMAPSSSNSPVSPHGNSNQGVTLPSVTPPLPSIARGSQ